MKVEPQGWRAGELSRALQGKSQRTHSVRAAEIGCFEESYAMTFEAFTVGTPFTGRESTQVERKPAPTGVGIPGAVLAPTKPLRRNTKRRLFLDASNARNAADLIGELPAEEESLHMISGTQFPAWSFVPGILKLIDPARIDVLRVSTLGSNMGNSLELLDMLDDCRIGRVAFVGSTYFRDGSASVWGHLTAELGKRGQGFVSCRNHSKLQLFEIGERRYVIETSANLRSNRNFEVATLTQSKPLHDFYAAWIDSLIAFGDVK
jgi:hypothetical protein